MMPKKKAIGIVAEVGVEESAHPTNHKTYKQPNPLDPQDPRDPPGQQEPSKHPENIMGKS